MPNEPVTAPHHGKHLHHAKQAGAKVKSEVKKFHSFHLHVTSAIYALQREYQDA